MDNNFNNEFATIEHDQTNNALMLTWHRFAKEEAFRSVMTKFYDLSAQTNATKWFFDSRKQGLISPTDQQWTVSQVIDRKLDTTSIKTAVVMPESLFMEVSVSKISRSIEQQTETPTPSENFQHFKSQEEALHWLNQ
ncbi:hypothetical protein BKI52_04700 [marine bacterium AO1-C]|nr:hypothetical protein BKI52_04700 [marine bacterium AO1-C]